MKKMSEKEREREKEQQQQHMQADLYISLPLPKKKLILFSISLAHLRSIKYIRAFYKKNKNMLIVKSVSYDHKCINSFLSLASISFLSTN
jgi:hypothetical protein